LIIVGHGGARVRRSHRVSSIACTVHFHVRSPVKPRRKLLVGIDVLAGALAMSRRQAYALVTEGVLPRAARGKYDLPVATSAYIEHLRTQQGDPDLLALRRAKAQPSGPSS
jgi:hypothetical protein